MINLKRKKKVIFFFKFQEFLTTRLLSQFPTPAQKPISFTSVTPNGKSDKAIQKRTKQNSKTDLALGKNRPGNS